MKMNRFVIMFVAVMMIFPAVVFAEVIQGVINELNTASNTLGITRINPVTGASEQLKVSISKDATFKGVNSLGELQVGTQVRLDAAPATAGVWRATAVEKA